MRCWACATARALTATATPTTIVPTRRLPTAGFLHPIPEIHVGIHAPLPTIAAGAANAGHFSWPAFAKAPAGRLMLGRVPRAAWKRGRISMWHAARGGHKDLTSLHWAERP